MAFVEVSDEEPELNSRSDAELFIREFDFSRSNEKLSDDSLLELSEMDGRDVLVPEFSFELSESSFGEIGLLKNYFF